jgi:para-nitrobenzyl esterase
VGADRVAGPGWGAVYDGVLLPDSVVTLFARGAYRHVPMLTGFNFREDAFRIMTAVANGGKLLTREDYEKQTRAAPRGEDLLKEYPVSAYSSAEDARTALMNDASACSAFDSVKIYSRHHPGYLYEFADPNPVPTLYEVKLPEDVHTWAFHTSEIAYIFQTGFPNELRRDPPPFSAAQKRLSDRMMEYWGNFVREGRPTKDDSWPSMSSKDAIHLLTPDGDSSMQERAFSARHKCEFWRSLR